MRHKKGNEEGFFVFYANFIQLGVTVVSRERFNGVIITVVWRG